MSGDENWFINERNDNGEVVLRELTPHQLYLLMLEDGVIDGLETETSS